MTVLGGLAGGKLKDLTPLRQGPLARVLEALNGGGEETRLVGGAVRDLALGERAFDFDLATTASTDEVIRRARAAGFKVALTGVAHGTVTIVVDGRPIETTTLRQDVETDGRRAKVAFGRDFSADAERRDFTINALSLGPDGTVHDSVGGLDDLAAGRVRFIGDANQRIREDYLRILRFFRFSARFAANGLDPEGLKAAIRAREGLARLSRERVRAELMKLIAARRAGEVVESMGECGFLEPILGGLATPGRLSRLIAIEAHRTRESDAVLRLAALSVAIPEDAERLRDRLRLANAEYERIRAAAAALVGLHGISAPPSREDLRWLRPSPARHRRMRPSPPLTGSSLRRPFPSCRSAARTSSPAASRPGRPSARRFAPFRRCGSGPAFPRSRRRSPACSRRPSPNWPGDRHRPREPARSPNPAKLIQIKCLGFAWFYSSEAGLFNRLWRKK
jgi:tRNA nucleotidyltransferase/poly(A) polymerase